jgi:hypothetical protein
MAAASSPPDHQSSPPVLTVSQLNSLHIEPPKSKLLFPPLTPRYSSLSFIFIDQNP